MNSVTVIGFSVTVHEEFLSQGPSLVCLWRSLESCRRPEIENFDDIINYFEKCVIFLKVITLHCIICARNQFFCLYMCASDRRSLFCDGHRPYLRSFSLLRNTTFQKKITYAAFSQAPDSSRENKQKQYTILVKAPSKCIKRR